VASTKLAIGATSKRKGGTFRKVGEHQWVHVADGGQKATLVEGRQPLRESAHPDKVRGELHAQGLRQGARANEMSALAKTSKEHRDASTEHTKAGHSYDRAGDKEKAATHFAKAEHHANEAQKREDEQQSQRQINAMAPHAVTDREKRPGNYESNPPSAIGSNRPSQASNEDHAANLKRAARTHDEALRDKTTLKHKAAHDAALKVALTHPDPAVREVAAQGAEMHRRKANEKAGGELIPKKTIKIPTKWTAKK
jgi:flagellar hook protein FlgE